MFEKLLNYITNNKKTILTFLGVFLFFYFTNFSFAADPVGWAEVSNNTVDKRSEILENIDGLFALIATVIWTVTQFVWLFLHPSWTNWDVFWMSEYIHELWILVSNVVYLLFMLLLIVIAFMNIIWKWEWNFELKQALPKLLLWVLMVPLSWVLITWLISISSMLAASVLTLPFDTFQNQPAVAKFLDKSICTHPVLTTHKLDFSFKNQTYINNGWENNADPNALWNKVIIRWKNAYVIECKKDLVDWKNKNIQKIGDLLSWPTSAYWILNVYTYWIFSLDNTMKVYSSSISSDIRTIFDLIIKIGFDFIFIIVYFILIIALWFALFIRWVWLWIYMIFSPVFWLFIFFWKGWSWFDEKFSIKELVALAMVPVYVSWALAFWLLFISVVWSWLENSPNTNLIHIEKNENDSSTLTILWTYHFTFNWTFGSTGNKEAAEDVNQLFATGLWALWVMILNMFWLVVLWLWVMAALKSSKITANIIEPISSLWDSAWKLMANAPKYIPIFPGGHTMQWLWNAGNTMENVVRQNALWKSNELWQAIWWAVSSAMWLQNTELTRALNTQNTRLKQIAWLVKSKNYEKTWQLIVSAIADIAKASWSKNINELLTNKNAWNETVKMLWENANFNDKVVERLQSATNKTDLNNKIKDLINDRTLDDDTRKILGALDWTAWSWEYWEHIDKAIVNWASSVNTAATSKYVTNVSEKKGNMQTATLEGGTQIKVEDWKLDDTNDKKLAEFIQKKNIKDEKEIEKLLGHIWISSEDIAGAMEDLWKYLEKDGNGLKYTSTPNWSWNTDWVSKSSGSWSGWGFNPNADETANNEYTISINTWWVNNKVKIENWDIKDTKDQKQMANYLIETTKKWDITKEDFKKRLWWEINDSSLKEIFKHIDIDDSWKVIKATTPRTDTDDDKKRTNEVIKKFFKDETPASWNPSTSWTP